ncbi:hypothetical protein C0J45_19322 [Silurus meridionalis]|nr:hypothetical protein C0J45_19322 [Silurus meridionalis]
MPFIASITNVSAMAPNRNKGPDSVLHPENQPGDIIDKYFSRQKLHRTQCGWIQPMAYEQLHHAQLPKGLRQLLTEEIIVLPRTVGQKHGNGNGQPYDSKGL